jgi:bacterioferritin
VKGDPEVVGALNELLTHELTAINQYYVHSKMCANWGYKALAKRKMDEAMEEMRHADQLIERILFLEGVPNMQKLGAVKVGEDAIEQHEADLGLEMVARERLNRFIALFTKKGDNGSRLLAEKILAEEEDAVDWLETQLMLVKEIGKEHYLAQQMRE